MARESFEDRATAEVLNQYFVSIKVDKEQRPDIDSIYMAVCQAFTGSGGWPTSIFMTANQKPFFAGTYFPPTSRHGMIGFKELLLKVQESWQSNRENLLQTANEITNGFNQQKIQESQAEEKILDSAVALFRNSYDQEFGGFGNAPKFPAPHNLLFLMQHHKKNDDPQAWEMVKKTLIQMYRGGIFDHIGYGFCRYSTDRYFLVPHFEKMLYDNALLILAYCRAFEISRNPFYREVAEKTASYVLSELTSAEGGFYCAQDADSHGVEGKYYVFEPREVIALLGEQNGDAFNRTYDITQEGNFEGNSIPNLLQSGASGNTLESFLPEMREYRHGRFSLYTDDKILTAWNSLMVAALSSLYRISQKGEYLKAARKAQAFIEKKLCDQNTLYVSYRDGKHSCIGFLDEYAFYGYALLCLYDATLENIFLERAEGIVGKAVEDFFDKEQGGFYLSGKENETLIFRPKETHDGAMPSGNSMMAYNLLRLNFLKPNDNSQVSLKKQLDFMSGEAERYPAGYAMFLSVLSDYFNPPNMITVVVKDKEDIVNLPFTVPLDSIIKVLEEPTEGFGLLEDKTTYYVCCGHSCLPPSNKVPY